MTVASALVRRYLGRAVVEQLQREFEAWQSSGVPAGAYVRTRLPAVEQLFDGQEFAGLREQIRRGATSVNDLQARRARSANSLEAAERLVERADAAKQRVDALESARDRLSQRRHEVEAIAKEAAAKVDEIVSRAKEEADLKVEAARQRMREIEERAALHVEEVEEKAKLTERSIVSTAEASFARASARLASDLDRARVDASSLRERADVALRRAEAEAEKTADVGDQQRESAQRLDADGAGGASSAQRRSKRSRRSQTAGGGSSPADLDSKSRDELYELARKAGIAGRSSMEKAALLKALRAL